MLPHGALFAVKGLNLWWRKLFYVAGLERGFECTLRSCGYNSPPISVRFNKTYNVTFYCLEGFFFFFYSTICIIVLENRVE